MKTTFTENLENNQLIAVRQLNAPIEKVWKAWSDKDILCQWWAPKPYTCEISVMDFRAGGHWMYSMTGPEGDVHRGRMDFVKMDEFKMIEAQDYFVDENGNAIAEIPPMQLVVNFESAGDTTTITSTTTFASPEALQQMAEMGAAEGWELAMNQLEELL